MKFYVGKYIGPCIPLRGEIAILQWSLPKVINEQVRGGVLAQFSNLERFGRVEDGLAFGWHWFPGSDWV